MLITAAMLRREDNTCESRDKTRRGKTDFRWLFSIASSRVRKSAFIPEERRVERTRGAKRSGHSTRNERTRSTCCYLNKATTYRPPRGEARVSNVGQTRSAEGGGQALFALGSYAKRTRRESFFRERGRGTSIRPKNIPRGFTYQVRIPKQQTRPSIYFPIEKYRK